MPKLTPKIRQLLKLIFLGPQPKDELYEEWSKDPLAEWFREQRLARSDRWPGARMAARLREEWTFALFICALVLYLIPYSPAKIAAIVTICALMLSGSFRMRFDSRRLRPPQRATFMFGLNVRRELLIDLWLSGVRGRDVAKMLYVEGGSLNSRVFDMALAALGTIYLMDLFSREGISIPWIILPVGFWVLFIAQRFIKIVAANPFERIDHSYWGMRDIPGIRAISKRALTSQPVPGADVPVVPVILLLGTAAIVMFLVGIGEFPFWTLYIAFAVVIAPFLVYVHTHGRRAPIYDRRMLKKEFRKADRYFDNWVRSELIGDEDVRRGRENLSSCGQMRTRSHDAAKH